MGKKLILLLILGVALIALFTAFRLGNTGSAAFWDISNNGRWFPPLVVVAALVDSANPCAFSVLLLTIAFLMSLGRVRSKIIAVGTSYITGIFAVYLLIGLGILRTLHLLNTPHLVAKIGATLLILFGAINLINEFFPSFPVKLRIPAGAHRPIAALMERASFPTAFLLGGLVGLTEFPCTGGPYLVILGLLHDHTTYILGFSYLVLYNFVFVLPLLVLLLVASSEPFLEKVRVWRRERAGAMRRWGSAAMILLGILIFFL